MSALGEPNGSNNKQEPLFRDLTADEKNPEATEIESMCVACEKNGVTRLLLTKIPMFREVIVSSFHCPHCGVTDSGIQSGAPIQDQGVRYSLQVQGPESLNRLVVRADTSSVMIPELEFEIPPSAKKGDITTVESILTQSVEGLEKEQPLRKALDPELATKINGFIDRLKACIQLKQTFTLIVDDPSGNSFVENKLAPKEDPNLTVEFYERSEDQNKQLGLTTIIESTANSSAEISTVADSSMANSTTVGQDEVMAFMTNCSSCHSATETRMKLVDIPHFKQVLVMATTCSSCGYKSNEVKSGTGVSETGTKIELKITDSSDLSRDVLKAETAILSIPELDLECEHRSLGGRFTTIEGLLREVKENLESVNPFARGDSATNTKFREFLDKLSEVIDGKKLNVHIVLDDPAGNSYIQNVYAPEPDPEMTVVHYQRTFEQNELLGLNEMKTEDYT